MPDIKTLTINGQTFTITDPDAASIDDTKVGVDAWSSKNIVDKLCPSFTEQGAVVTCEPIEGTAINFSGNIDVCNLKEVQSGNIVPSPTNVLPIIGWDAMTVSHTGKNFFDFKDELVSMNGMVRSDGIAVTNDAYWGLKGQLPVGKYIITAKQDKTPERAEYLYAAKNNNGSYVETVHIIQDKNRTPVTLNINEGDVIYFYNALSGQTQETASSVFKCYNIMLVPGNTQADYEPFCGSIVTIHFNQTVYGGTYDSQSGLLTIEYGINKVKDFTDWEMNTNGTFSTMSLVGKAVYVTNGKPPIGLCSHYKGVSLNDLGNHDDAYTLGRNGTAECRIKDTSFTTVESFLAEMGECQILYQLVKPRTVQLTPQEFIALSSENFLGCNTGDITITGKADPAATIKKLTERIAALEATAVNNI